MKKASVLLEIIYDETQYDHPGLWNYTALLDQETKVLSMVPPVDVTEEDHKHFKPETDKHKKKQ